MQSSSIYVPLYISVKIGKLVILTRNDTLWQYELQLSSHW